jgi:hypothetical protein
MDKIGISALRSEWKALQSELLKGDGWLDPVPLMDDQFDAILRGRTNPLDKVYRAHLPLTVAKFRKEAAKEICRHMPNQGRNWRNYENNRSISDNFAGNLANGFVLHLQCINQVLFQTKISDAYYVAGLFRAAIDPAWHEDSGECGEKPYPFYVTRLHALPAEFIPDSKRIEWAALCNRIRNDDDFYEALRTKDIPQRTSLGDVILFAGRGNTPWGTATLHRSSPISEKGEQSVLFRAIGEYPSPGLR